MSFPICVLDKNTGAYTGFEPEIGDSHYEGGALMKYATVSPNYFESTNSMLFLYKIIKEYLSRVHVIYIRRKTMNANCHSFTVYSARKQKCPSDYASTS